MPFEFTEYHAKLIEETHDKVIKIETIIGNGTQGLFQQVRNNTKAITKIWLILAFIAGGGGLGLGIIELIKFMR